MSQVHASLIPGETLAPMACSRVSPEPSGFSHAPRMQGAESAHGQLGAAPVGGGVRPYLWLKVCRPMDADAKTTDLQKLEVWPKHRAKTLDSPRPITCGREGRWQGMGCGAPLGSPGEVRGEAPPRPARGMRDTRLHDKLVPLVGLRGEWEQPRPRHVCQVSRAQRTHKHSWEKCLRSARPARSTDPGHPLNAFWVG